MVAYRWVYNLTEIVIEFCRNFSDSDGIGTFRDLFLHISGLDAGEYIHQMCISKPPKKRKFLANSGAAAVKSNFVGKSCWKKACSSCIPKIFFFFPFLKKIHIPLIWNSYMVSQKFIINKKSIIYITGDLSVIKCTNTFEITEKFVWMCILVCFYWNVLNKTPCSIEICEFVWPEMSTFLRFLLG